VSVKIRESISREFEHKFEHKFADLVKIRENREFLLARVDTPKVLRFLE